MASYPSIGIGLVLIKPKLKRIDRVSTIAHEVSHVIDFMLEDMGEIRPGEEFKAYSTGYLTSRMIKQYEKWWKK